MKDNNGTEFEITPSSAAEQHCAWLRIKGDANLFPANNTGWQTKTKAEICKALGFEVKEDGIGGPTINYPDALHIDFTTAVLIIKELAEYFDIPLCNL